MHFTTSVSSLIVAALASITLAAPMTSRPQALYPRSNSTAGPSATDIIPGHQIPIEVATILPLYTSQFNGRTGAHFHTQQGLVSKAATNDISTLVTFWVGSEYADNDKYICKVVFDTTLPSSTATGSRAADLWTSLAPAGADAASWPSGNLRDQLLGRVVATAGGRAAVDPTVTGSFVIPCANIAGKLLGGEVVPVGQEDSISWTAGVDGPKIIISEIMTS